MNNKTPNYTPQSELTSAEAEADKKAEELAEDNGLDKDINRAYIDNVGIEYAEADDVTEAYQGQFDNDEDFTQDLLEQTGTLPRDLPPYIHIDWEATANDIMMDYFEENGYYFRNL